MNDNDIELLDDDTEVDKIKPIPTISVDITKPIDIIEPVEQEEINAKPILIEPEAVLSSISANSNNNNNNNKTTEKKLNTTFNNDPKMVSPEDVIAQVGTKIPQMISPEDVMQQVGTTRSKTQNQNMSFIQKNEQLTQNSDDISKNVVETFAPTNPINTPVPTTIYIPPTNEEITEEIKPKFQNPNKDYRIALLFVAVVILFSLGIITSIFSNSGNTLKSIDKTELTTNIIENENGNSYFYSPINNTKKSGSSDETTYYLLGEEKSGQSEIYNILEKNYMKNSESSINGQNDKLIEIGPIKNDKNINVILPVNYNNLNERLIKSTNKDGSIIVIRTSVGLTSKVEEHLRLMNQLGAEKTIIFINQDDNQDDTDKIIKQVKNLLKKTGYDEKTPIIIGDSKQEESVKELYDEMKEWIRIVPDNTEELLRAYIEKVEEDNDLAKIRVEIENGTIKVGDKVKILGEDYSETTTVNKIYINNHQKDEATAKDEYDEIYIWVETKADSQMKKAKMLVSEKSSDIHSKFKAIFYYSDNNNVQTRVFNNNYSTDIQLSSNVYGKITIPNEINYIMKNDTSNLTIELSKKVPLFKGQKFTINDQKNNIFGYGEVTDIIN